MGAGTYAPESPLDRTEGALMAARRLVAVLVVLMVFSTLAAALAPDIEQDEEGETTTTTERAQPAQPAGAVLRESFDAGAERPARIEARAGDRLELLVRSKRSVEVAIPDYGLLATAVEGAPARFDLLLRERGRIEVELLDGTPVGAIEVEAPD